MIRGLLTLFRVLFFAHTSVCLHIFVWRDLGLKSPPLFPDNKATFAALSMEKLPEVNPDHINLLNESNDKLEEMKKSAIWNQLKAVQKNQIHEVQYDLWFQGFGPTAYSLIWVRP